VDQRSRGHMPAITYNLSIPNAPNNPSSDQPLMQINTNAINTWTGVDHLNFANTDAGKHAKVTYATTAAPGAQVNPASVAYTKAGAASSVSDNYFTNQNGTFLLNCVRACGNFQMTNANNPALGSTQSMNVSGIASTGNGIVYTITFSANILSGAYPTNQPIVLITSSASGVTFSYTFTATNVLRIQTSQNSTAAFISFAVIQI